MRAWQRIGGSVVVFVRLLGTSIQPQTPGKQLVLLMLRCDQPVVYCLPAGNRLFVVRRYRNQSLASDKQSTFLLFVVCFGSVSLPDVTGNKQDGNQSICGGLLPVCCLFVALQNNHRTVTPPGGFPGRETVVIFFNHPCEKIMSPDRKGSSHAPIPSRSPLDFIPCVDEVNPVVRCGGHTHKTR